MAITINTLDNEESIQNITLNKKTYTLITRYNSRFGYWLIDLYNSSKEPLILGEKVLPNKDLLTRYDKHNTLGGYFFIRSLENSSVDRDNLGIGKPHTLMFATFEEIVSFG